MNLFLLGVSHRTAPVELREKLDFSSGSVGAAVQELAARASVPECVLLSTCNRSEIYVASPDPARTRQEVIDFLSEFHGLPAGEFEPHLFALTDRDAVGHLFRVSAGLDSVVVGEPQILGQVKDAFQAASERRCTGPLLGRLFTSSFGVGKRVRTETAIGAGAVSVSNEAVAIAKKIFETLDGRHVLVIGAGDISALTAKHLRDNGVGDIVITSRTHANAVALAEAVGGRSTPWSNLTQALSAADIVITATGAARPIITRADVEAAIGRHRADPLYIIDLAVPRDVEPSVGDIEQVFLYNIDDLQKFVEKNVTNRGAEVQRAEAIVSEEVERFVRWHRSRGAVPTIVALRNRFYAIRESELQRLEGKFAGLSPEARERFEEVTRLMIEKLLLEPTEQLKALPDEETQMVYTEVLKRLFRIPEHEPEASPEPARGRPRTK
jgi:glutamyl-tRNA reductase